MVTIKPVNIDAYDDLVTEEMYNDILTQSMKNIKQLIYKSGISTPALADELNMDAGNMYRLMNGSRKLSFKQILIFARYFNVPLSYIIPETNEELHKYDMEFLDIIVGWSEKEIKSALEILYAYKQVKEKHT